VDEGEGEADGQHDDGGHTSDQPTLPVSPEHEDVFSFVGEQFEMDSISSDCRPIVPDAPMARLGVSWAPAVNEV
jgi:hypothetical protein